MECRSLHISKHAMERIVSRDIHIGSLPAVIAASAVIEEYLDDRPHPSYLLLGFAGKSPLHLVVARTETMECILITAYYPDPEQWDSKFKIRKKV
ncbi:MAG: DUF4258 domain-containing protein [Spirochaetales bacterium]|nr:DUF4258 domain-containing protein [Spirochaetales bacterium]